MGQRETLKRELGKEREDQRNDRALRSHGGLRERERKKREKKILDKRWLELR